MLIRRWLLIMVALVSFSFAQDELMGIKISGWGFYTFGKVVSGFSQGTALANENYFPLFTVSNNGDTTKFMPIHLSKQPDQSFDKRWLSDFQAGLKLEKEISDYTKVRVHFGFTTVFQLKDYEADGGNGNLEYSQKKFAAYLVDVGIEHGIELDDVSKLRFEFGYLPTRYNPQAANLGEYLFRCNAYPTVVESGFDLADKEKITGLHLEYTREYGEASKIKADFYTYTEMKFIPLYDFSPAILFSLNHENLFEVGCGAVYNNLISVNEKETTPGKNTGYAWGNGYVDPVTKDTTLYTVRALKAMGRITLNPKTLIMEDDESIFGQEDLKLFTEMAIIGVINYPGWYSDMGDRMPLMFGINLPAFKVLDLVSLQFQYWKNPYFNTKEGMIKASQIVPYIGHPQMSPSYEQYTQNNTATGIPDGNDNLWPVVDWDDWKWSLLATKTINKRVKLFLQFASDNMKKDKYMPPPPAQSKYTEICSRTWDVDKNGKYQWGKIYDWYWHARIMFFL